MVYILYTIFFLSCVVLIGSVLLQPGKTDAGALFTSNISSSSFGPRGTQSILAKFSIGAAIVFMLSALFLSMPALTGNVSVLSTTEEVQTETAPAASDNANIDLSTNTNSAVQVDANNLSNSIIVTNANSVNAVVSNTNTANATASNANSATSNTQVKEVGTSNK